MHAKQTKKKIENNKRVMKKGEGGMDATCFILVISCKHHACHLYSFLASVFTVLSAVSISKQQYMVTGRRRLKKKGERERES